MNSELKVMPIVDKIIKDFRGRIANFVELPSFTFGKELQTHVLEIKPSAPFRSPENFEGTMHEAVLAMVDFLQSKYEASLLGTGMHPLVRLEETDVWAHRHRQIYQAYSTVFNLRRHGWLNIQSFQLNLPYSDEEAAVRMHNSLAEICAYLPAVAASSPIYEGKIGDLADNRLGFYLQSQKEVPSVVGDLIPEYVSSFEQYKKEIIGRYSLDLANAGVDKCILYRDWVNSRGAIFRFDRKAIEIRVIDEQECVKSDVALSCFVRALTRGMMKAEYTLLPHKVLVKDFHAIIAGGLNAKVLHPRGRIARQVCEYYYGVAWRNATEEEKRYFPIIERRIRYGNLSDIIRKKVQPKAQKTSLREAIVSVYLSLVESLIKNQPYF